MKKPIEPGQYLAHDTDFDEWDVFYYDGENWAVRNSEITLVLRDQAAIDDYIPRYTHLKYSLDE